MAMSAPSIPAFDGGPDFDRFKNVCASHRILLESKQRVYTDHSSSIRIETELLRLERDEESERLRFESHKQLETILTRLLMPGLNTAVEAYAEAVREVEEHRRKYKIADIKVDLFGLPPELITETITPIQKIIDVQQDFTNTNTYGTIKGIANSIYYMVGGVKIDENLKNAVINIYNDQQTNADAPEVYTNFFALDFGTFVDTLLQNVAGARTAVGEFASFSAGVHDIIVRLRDVLSNGRYRIGRLANDARIYPFNDNHISDFKKYITQTISEIERIYELNFIEIRVLETITYNLEELNVWLTSTDLMDAYTKFNDAHNAYSTAASSSPPQTDAATLDDLKNARDQQCTTFLDLMRAIVQQTNNIITYIDNPSGEFHSFVTNADASSTMLNDIRNTMQTNKSRYDEALDNANRAKLDASSLLSTKESNAQTTRSVMEMLMSAVSPPP